MVLSDLYVLHSKYQEAHGDKSKQGFILIWPKKFTT